MQERTNAGNKEYEDLEDEEDPDCPYPSILQHVDVDLGTEALHVAVPRLPNSAYSRSNSTFGTHGVLAVACSDGCQRVLSFPLAPPTDADKESFLDLITQMEMSPPSSGPLCRAVEVKVISGEVLDERGETGASAFLLVAAITDKLHIYRTPVAEEFTTVDTDWEHKTAPLPHLALGLSFHPAEGSTQLAIPDTSGAVRIYDPYVPSRTTSRPSSAGSGLEPAHEHHSGSWICAYHTSFATGGPALAKRKHLLAAEWIMNGKAVLALLDDGEWGIWDVSGSSGTGKNIETFVLNGFLGMSSVHESAEPANQRHGQPRLAPMTPNTRKAKAEVLFSGPAKTIGVAPKGGISVSSSSSRSGQLDESVVMWYNNSVYSIPSLQQFWQRSTNSSGGFGSLYSPGLAHINDINLKSEQITSISQFAVASNNFGQMNTQRDLLISAEHRLIILQTSRPATPARSLFQAVERPTARDQRMLDAGELDLGSMDRMLDSMANSDARPRRVGFASSS